MERKVMYETRAKVTGSGSSERMKREVKIGTEK